jgi:hypothetical protein
MTIKFHADLNVDFNLRSLNFSNVTSVLSEYECDVED